MSKVLSYTAILIIAFALLISSAQAEETSPKEADEQTSPSAEGKYIAVPKSMIRFLVTDDRYSSANLKRASNPASYNADVMSLGGFGKRWHIEPISTGGFGKRSRLLNLEPLYGRYGSRFMPRMSDIRWAPFDAYDSTDSNQDNL